MINRTVFIDTSMFDVILLNNPQTGYQQIQDLLTTNNLSAEDIDFVSASANLNERFNTLIIQSSLLGETPWP